MCPICASTIQAVTLEHCWARLKPGLRADLVLLPAGALARPEALRRLSPERVWVLGWEQPS